MAAALLSSGLLLVFSSTKTESENRLWIGFFLLSSAVLVEHLLVVVFFPVLVSLIKNRCEYLLRASLIFKVFVAGFIPMVVLMLYNWTCFDSPVSIAHFHHATDTQNHDIGTLLRFDHALTAATNLLFGATKAEVGRQDLVSLFSSSPFMYFTLAFFLLVAVGYHRFTTKHFVLITSIILLTLGGSSVFAPYGGWDRDYRYFMAIIPLFAPLLGVVLDFLVNNAHGRVIMSAKYLVLLIFMWLLFLSVKNQVAHIRHDGQIQYTHLFVNYEAALVNVSLFLALVGGVITFTVLLPRAFTCVVNRAS